MLPRQMARRKGWPIKNCPEHTRLSFSLYVNQLLLAASRRSTMMWRETIINIWEETAHPHRDNWAAARQLGSVVIRRRDHWVCFGKLSEKKTISRIYPQIGENDSLGHKITRRKDPYFCTSSCHARSPDVTARPINKDTWLQHRLICEDIFTHIQRMFSPV